MSTALFHGIREGRISEELNTQFPFVPLDAPLMPLPGEDFIAAAIAMGDQPPRIEGNAKTRRLVEYGPNLHYLYRRALYDETFHLPVNVRGQWKSAQCIPGHIFGDDTANCNGGPRPAKVMVVGKNPGREELQHQCNYVGPSSSVFFDALIELGVGETEWANWYASNLVHWPQLDDQSDTLPISHKKDCAILLEQELRLVRPDFLLCLGTDASKWVLGDAYGVQSLVGRVVDLHVPIWERGEEQRYHPVKVMGLVHPAQVYRRPEMYDEFKSQLGLFLSLINGGVVGGTETGLRHTCVYTVRHLEAIVNEIRNDPNLDRRLIAVDAEWEGAYPTEPGAYLRTVQFSSAHGEGITVVLRHQGGSQAFQPGIGHAIALLNKLLKYDPAANWYPRIGGHFFRADLPWLIHSGLDLRQEYAPAPTIEQAKTFGGWDTGLMYHAVNESTSYRLTDMLVRLTTAPVYDTGVKEAITGYCKAHDIKKEDLDGFGFLPSWKLHSENPAHGPNYAAYDADCARRIAKRCMEPSGLLDKDWFDNPSWEPFWVAHRASLGFLEMEMHGLVLDKARVDMLFGVFSYAREKLLEDFRRKINWPTFNPGSHQQCVNFLFGDELSTKRDKATGQRISVRPPGAVTLNLEPLKTTGKRSRLWADIVSRGEQHMFNPSTDKEVVGILGHSHPIAMQLRDLRFVAQIINGPLRPPSFNAEGVAETDDNGNMIYEEGLAAWVHADGRVRTHFSQTKETGRAGSARPPLQNLANRRESDYARILGTYNRKTKQPEGAYIDVLGAPLYQHPIRSIFRAADGCVIVGSDYSVAEVAVLAFSANDAAMIDHVRRSGLPKDHPDYYEIHSQTAVRCFRLSCAPTKKGLEEAGLSSLRIAAKNVRFGIPYGRSAEAIARQCREEGVDVTADDCQKIIDYFFNTYTSTEAYLRQCRSRSQNERWVAGSYGRKRRFIRSRERSVIGDQERQSQNFAIQNTVADMVQTAIYNFIAYRGERPDILFYMASQLHDALEFEVPIPHVGPFCREALPTCMVQRVPLWPRYLDNTPMPVQAPYYLGIEHEIYTNWGEPLDAKGLAALGIDPELA